MKTFLTYSAIIEALTGLGLIIVPKVLVNTIFATDLNSTLATLLCMLAGVAIFSIAWAAWMVRPDIHPKIEVKMLLFYNAAVFLVLLYGALQFGFGGMVLWCVIIFHFVQTVISIMILKKKIIKTAAP
jgi:hypothetical protein